MKISVFSTSLLFCALSALAWGQVVPSASVITAGSVFDGGGAFAPDSVILALAGSADAGVGRTENVIWRPDGTPEILGNLSLGDNVYTPSQGAGLYWLQFRLVDTNNNYSDQWLSFTVQPGFLIPQASAAQATDTTFLLTQNGQSSAGVAWTENVIWHPDGTAEVLGDLPMGSMSYVPSAGPGVYSYQFRIVDANLNFKDQWLTFTVNP